MKDKDLERIYSEVRRLESDKEQLSQELKTVKAQLKALELSQKAQASIVKEQAAQKPSNLLESHLLSLYEAACASGGDDYVQYYREQIPQIEVARALELSKAALLLKVLAEYTKNNGINLKKRPFFADLEIIAKKWQVESFPTSENRIKAKVVPVVKGVLPETLIGGISKFNNQNARKSNK